MEATEAAEILVQYTNENLGYGYVTQLDPETDEAVRALQLRIGPLPIASPGGFEHALASRIAKKHGISFEEYNFNRGTDDPPLYQPIFSALCYGVEDIETKMGKITQAEAELTSKLENLAEFAMGSE